MGFNQQHNKDNIHIRSVIVGLINMLNNQIFYENVIDDERYDIIEVPFFPSYSGDERFLQDFYLQWNDCIHPKLVDGVIDPVPRGVVTLKDINIDTAGLTQRWIRGEFTKMIKGNIETFSAYINSLPLSVTFDIQITCDTQTEAFKIIQAIFDTFYRVRIYNVNYKGFMIPCQASFPESYPLEKTLEFTYPSDRDIKIEFPLEIETYYPVIDEPNLGTGSTRDMLAGDGTVTQRRLSNADFDAIMRRRRGMKNYDGSESLENSGNIFDNLSSKMTSLRHASNKMNAVIVNKTDDAGNSLTLINPKNNEKFYSSDILRIEWTMQGFIDKLNIFYSDDAGVTWKEIQLCVDASMGYYEWKIPRFQKLIQGIIIYDKLPLIQAEVLFLIDNDGHIFDYIIINEGLGYNETTVIEIESNVGSGAKISPVIQNGKITSMIIYDGGVNYESTIPTTICLKIVSSIDENIYDILKKHNGTCGDIIINANHITSGFDPGFSTAFS